MISLGVDHAKISHLSPSFSFTSQSNFIVFTRILLPKINKNLIPSPIIPSTRFRLLFVNSRLKMLKLYSFWKSSCSHRVRIALNLKGLNFEYKPVNLLKGEQFSPEYEKLNPMRYVPTLVDGDVVIADSLAILMYLEDKYPQHPLLPRDLSERAINYQIANVVSSSIQPLQNLVVLKHIEEISDPAEKLRWVESNFERGFTALEKLVKAHAGKYATGDKTFLADVFLAPQIHGAISRSSVDMSKFPLLSRLNEEYDGIAAFQDALPAKQPDATQSS